MRLLFRAHRGLSKSGSTLRVIAVIVNQWPWGHRLLLHLTAPGHVTGLRTRLVLASGVAPAVGRCRLGVAVEGERLPLRAGVTAGLAAGFG